MSMNPLDSLNTRFNHPAAVVKGKGTLGTLASQNKAAVKAAAVDAVGRAANAAVIAAVRNHLPMMVRGYADHPVANILAANLVNAAVQQTGVGGDKGRILSYAMIQSAYLDLGRSFDIEAMVNSLINKLPTSAFETLKTEMAANAAE